MLESRSACDEVHQTYMIPRKKKSRGLLISVSTRTAPRCQGQKTCGVCYLSVTVSLAPDLARGVLPRYAYDGMRISSVVGFPNPWRSCKYTNWGTSALTLVISVVNQHTRVTWEHCRKRLINLMNMGDSQISAFDRLRNIRRNGRGNSIASTGRL